MVALLFLCSGFVVCVPFKKAMRLATYSPRPWLPPHALLLPTRSREQNNVGGRGQHVHKSQRPRRRSRGARQGDRKKREKQTDGCDAPEGADRAPGEPADDGEYGSRANSASHAGGR